MQIDENDRLAYLRGSGNRIKGPVLGPELSTKDSEAVEVKPRGEHRILIGLTLFALPPIPDDATVCSNDVILSMG